MFIPRRSVVCCKETEKITVFSDGISQCSNWRLSSPAYIFHVTKSIPTMERKT